VRSKIPKHLKAQTNQTIRWLLEGDPAIRWQVLRDLVAANDREIERERKKIGREGWGALLLNLQDPAGTWAGGQSGDGGLYSPKWISTTYTMLTLRDFGLTPGNRQASSGALDYFQAVNAPRDLRLKEAIEIVQRKQSNDGR
jgi:hypothetical protein